MSRPAVARGIPGAGRARPGRVLFDRQRTARTARTAPRLPGFVRPEEGRSGAGALLLARDRRALAVLARGGDLVAVGAASVAGAVARKRQPLAAELPVFELRLLPADGRAPGDVLVLLLERERRLLLLAVGPLDRDVPRACDLGRDDPEEHVLSPGLHRRLLVRLPVAHVEGVR